jgi:hypothetical protein
MGDFYNKRTRQRLGLGNTEPAGSGPPGIDNPAMRAFLVGRAAEERWLIHQTKKLLHDAGGGMGMGPEEEVQRGMERLGLSSGAPPMAIARAAARTVMEADRANQMRAVAGRAGASSILERQRLERIAAGRVGANSLIEGDRQGDPGSRNIFGKRNPSPGYSRYLECRHCAGNERGSGERGRSERSERCSMCGCERDRCR